jgi:APA family basic amino acid/polyamine antiporter
VSGPRKSLPALSVVEASAIIIGIVVGIGIFKTPPIVAANVDSEFAFIGLWLIGGLLTVVGALCYAELGSARPHAGGEYHYLKEAYGHGLGFLFAWGRMTVMQTGAIAAVAFAYGDYAATVISLGPSGPALHAALAVIVLAGLQLAGTQISSRVQVALTLLTVVLVVVVAVAGFIGAQVEAAPQAVSTQSKGAAGLALVFILLTYGGWNEAAYLSGEIRDAPRNVLRVLLTGTGVVTALYLLINIALLSSVGLDGLREEKLVTEPVEAVFGSLGVVAVAVIVCVAALSTLNGTMFTGARSILALGQNFPLLSPFGEINQRSGAPTNAILVQAAIALGLIGFGATTRDGFTAMVEYTAPTFWMFMALVGFSLFIFRWREPGRQMPFRVPLYPLVPIVFCATAVYLVHASVAYTGVGALVGLAILASGIPLYWLGRRIEVRSPIRRDQGGEIRGQLLRGDDV